MSILYSVISQQGTILVDYEKCKGNFKEVAQIVIADIPPDDDKRTYFRGDYSFHYICEDGLIFMCITDKVFGKITAFLYLTEIKNTFQSKFGQDAHFLEGFDIILARGIKYYSGNLSLDTLSRTHTEMDELKAILEENLEKLVGRGKELDQLLIKAQRMSYGAIGFNRLAEAIHRRQYWKNVKFWLAIVLVMTAMGYFIVSMACGGLLWKKCV